MPTPQEAALRSLRMKYKSASTAHRGCLQALAEAKQRGEQPTAELIEQEVRALRAVEEAGADLFAAMAQAPGD
jgi:hypothetical protein